MIDTVIIGNDLLKGSLTDAMVFRGKAGDIDGLKTGGFYLTDNTATSAFPFPVALFQGILEVFPRSGGALQRFTPTNCLAIYQRFYSYNSNSWSAWYKFEGVKVS